jgi:biotin synthase
MLEQFKKKLFSNQQLSSEEAYSLITIEDDAALFQVAHEITQHFLFNKFDSCSIINARSGNCSEDCKWCAQSACYNTDVETYPFVSQKEAVRHAKHHSEQGVKRFALVTSGKRVTNRDAQQLAGHIEAIKSQTDIKVCASMGLVKPSQLKILREAGAENYHCNIETSPSNFANLCSTHTLEDKMQTIQAARKAGFRICSGGIIGMGETMSQRIEMALFLQQHNVFSIPLNILSPIPNTPLAHIPLISEREIMRTIAFFRFINPKAYLRFSGGRARLSRETQQQCLKIGINAAITGDLLTTTGAKINADMQMFKAAGFDLMSNSDWSEV